VTGEGKCVFWSFPILLKDNESQHVTVKHDCFIRVITVADAVQGMRRDAVYRNHVATVIG